MPSNLAAIVLNRELSSKRNYRPSIELLLESSYFTNSDRKHLAEDFPLNDTGQLFSLYDQCISFLVFYLHLEEKLIALVSFFCLHSLLIHSFNTDASSPLSVTQHVSLSKQSQPSDCFICKKFVILRRLRIAPPLSYLFVI